jgi:predicted ribosome quality control (RQC) complex YloA/Tae2 family protein
VSSLRNDLISLRVVNVYDVNPKTYLLKLAKPDHKQFLLIESGVRVHTTEFMRDKSQIPSVFAMKVCWFVGSVVGQVLDLLC